MQQIRFKTYYLRTQPLNSKYLRVEVDIPAKRLHDNKNVPFELCYMCYGAQTSKTQSIHPT